jgi:hypothetical protein
MTEVGGSILTLVDFTLGSHGSCAPAAAPAAKRKSCARTGQNALRTLTRAWLLQCIAYLLFAACLICMLIACLLAALRCDQVPHAAHGPGDLSRIDLYPAARASTRRQEVCQAAQPQDCQSAAR